jgi:hypothetical protein
MAAKEQFFQAIYSGEVKTAERIWRDNGLSANVKDSATGIGGTHALGYAVQLGAHAFAEELIANGADVNARGEDGITPMWQATDRAGVELLRRHDGDPNIPLTRGGERFSRGAVALHRAAASGDPDLVAALIEAGGNVLAIDRDGVTPLHYAAQSNEEAVRLLVRAGADLDATDKFGNTPRQALDKAFPHFQLEDSVAQTKETAIAPAVTVQQEPLAPDPQARLADYEHMVGKMLKTSLGEYHFIVADRPVSTGLTFIPNAGSLDEIKRFENVSQLRSHLEQDVQIADDRHAVEAFYELSEGHKIAPQLVPNTIERADGAANEVVDPAKAIASRMAKANWYYAYSDDSSVRAAGAESVRAALADLEAFAKVDREKAISLWDEFGVKHISAPAFLRDLNITERAQGVDVVQQQPEVAALQAVENMIQQAPAKDSRAVESAKQAEQAQSGENTIQAAPGTATRRPSPAHDDAIARAPSSRDAASGAASLPNAGAESARVDGPSTLLNGRFVRRDNGEYFRVADGQESKRVALVDENEKIRFVDKQMDAFQAAIELAKHKQWEAILVTGTEKFRAEAWHHARMAGLEVVGYEPSEKDLATLEAAKSGGREQPAATQSAVSSKDVSTSKKAAEDHAINAGSVVVSTNSASGVYPGKIIHQTEHHVVQDVGKKAAVIHDKARFDAGELKKAIDRGDSLRIQYNKGRGEVEAKQDRRRDQSVSR